MFVDDCFFIEQQQDKKKKKMIEFIIAANTHMLRERIV